ncbi:hypothetical protein [Escherichia coli]|uniref:hypothetical protein n=1 Tax=Escherichia coli TaxID=562 RepID=UPI000DA4A99F|nr:hypothetical protein [Escherichia coli]SQK57731.1 Uncharacterised protein [Escherichia coli]
MSLNVHTNNIISVNGFNYQVQKTTTGVYGVCIDNGFKAFFVKLWQRLFGESLQLRQALDQWLEIDNEFTACINQPYMEVMRKLDELSRLSPAEGGIDTNEPLVTDLAKNISIATDELTTPPLPCNTRDSRVTKFRIAVDNLTSYLFLFTSNTSAFDERFRMLADEYDQLISNCNNKMIQLSTQQYRDTINRFFPKEKIADAVRKITAVQFRNKLHLATDNHLAPGSISPITTQKCDISIAAQLLFAKNNALSLATAVAENKKLPQFRSQEYIDQLNKLHQDACSVFLREDLDHGHPSLFSISSKVNELKHDVDALSKIADFIASEPNRRTNDLSDILQTLPPEFAPLCLTVHNVVNDVYRRLADNYQTPNYQTSQLKSQYTDYCDFYSDLKRKLTTFAKYITFITKGSSVDIAPNDQSFVRDSVQSQLQELEGLAERLPSVTDVLNSVKNVLLSRLEATIQEEKFLFLSEDILIDFVRSLSQDCYITINNVYDDVLAYSQLNDLSLQISEYKEITAFDFIPKIGILATSAGYSESHVFLLYNRPVSLNIAYNAGANDDQAFCKTENPELTAAFYNLGRLHAKVSKEQDAALNAAKAVNSSDKYYCEFLEHYETLLEEYTRLKNEISPLHDKVFKSESPEGRGTPITLGIKKEASNKTEDTPNSN